MNNRHVNMLADIFPQYPTEQQKKRVLAYFDSMDDRIEAAKRIQAVERKAVGICIRKMKSMYPNFEKLHKYAWAKGYRDVQLVSRCTVLGMILNDVEYQDHKLLVWLRTMLGGNGMTPKFIQDCYTLLMQAYQQLLSEEDFVLFEPHLTQNIETTSDFSEPAEPRV